MIIDCISDLHGHYPDLEGGDLLIVAGNLTANDTCAEHKQCWEWLDKQIYEKKIVIAGNHDNFAYHVYRAAPEHTSNAPFLVPNMTYLCDSGTEFEWFETEDTKWGARHLDGCRHLKLKIWGSPWTKTFEGMNPHCKAFTVDTEEELAEKWKLIPDDVDILVTHSPPNGIGDQTIEGKHVGSISLSEQYCRIKPLIHVWGHIHESYGQLIINHERELRYINASHVNEHYQPVNKPIRVIL